MNKSKFLKDILLFLTVMSFSFSFKKSDATELDSPVAFVNHRMITTKQVTQKIKFLNKHIFNNTLSEADYPKLFHEALEQTIQEEMLMQQAGDITAYFDNNAFSEQMNAIVKEKNIVLENETEKLQFQKMVMTEELKRGILQNANVEINDRDVAEQTRQFPSSKEPLSLPEQYHIKDLWIPFETKNTSRFAFLNRVETLLQNIPLKMHINTAKNLVFRQEVEDTYQQLKDGTSFSTLLRTHPKWRVKDFKWRTTSTLPDSYAKRVRNLKKGAVMAPLYIGNGARIACLVDKKATTAIVTSKIRYILLKQKGTVTSDAIKKKLEKMREEVLKTGRFKQYATQYSEDPHSALQGGSLGWLTTKSIMEKFGTSLNHLLPGDISLPFELSTGWCIVQLVARQPLFAGNLLKDQIKIIKDTLHQRKAEKELEKIFDILRSQSYIKYVER